MRLFWMIALFAGVLAHAETKWEYARLDSCTYQFRNGSSIGTCRLQFATGSGWRSETVEFGGFPQVSSDPQYAASVNMDSALAKALAQMGGQGWELVTVIGNREHPMANSWMLFKRPVKGEPDKAK